MTSLVTGFFAYPSYPPMLAEAVREAIKSINVTKQAKLVSWEELSISGKHIIQEICTAIESRPLFCADITGLNPNVMFELGFAIAKDKRIFLILDNSIESSNRDFQSLRILTTIGYSQYTNSQQILSRFSKERPYVDLQATIYNSSIKPAARTRRAGTLLYLKSKVDTEAANALSKRIGSSQLEVIIDDPRETSARPLSWYAESVFGAESVICHFLSPKREGHTVHNAKYALVAGLAHGLGCHVLMLNEDDYIVPIDYRDMLRLYKTAEDAKGILETWISPLEAEYRNNREASNAYQRRLALAEELSSIDLGDYVAENEERSLPDYFVETQAFHDAFRGQNSIFVGRKGVGKSANFIALKHRWESDKRNIVCVIKPVDYQVQGLARLLKHFRHRDTKGNVVESLWKFLLYTEIAKRYIEEFDHSISSRPGLQESEELRGLRVLMESNDGLFNLDFVSRLERCVDLLTGIDLNSASFERIDLSISEAIHSEMISKLRKHIGEILHDEKRIFILIDNLDKAWDRSEDIDELIPFLLGLLSVSRRIIIDLGKNDPRRKSVAVGFAIFLRSDIYYRLLESAPEPDKISAYQMTWSDSSLLLRVIEQRYVEHKGNHATPEQFWGNYFCSTVNGRPIKDYLLEKIVKRPRDLLFFIKAAISTAVNRQHARVEEADIAVAERQYSSFVLDSIRVENGISAQKLEDILLGFSGGSALRTASEIGIILSENGIPDADFEKVIDHLCRLSFLGIEVEVGDFRYSEDPREHRKNKLIAARRSRTGTEPLYRVHPAFWAYLELV